eukprot:gene10800-13221_t
MEFNGILNNHLQGFYKSQYINATNGNEQFVMCTQFEPTDARRAFPCFDEPSLKASFIIKLTIDRHLTAISNMTEQSIVINPHSNSKTIKFYETPLMSTYVLGFMIGDFQYIERMTKEEVRVRVYSVKGTKENSEFALEVATKTLSFFTNYFEIPYPLTKCDQVAIPEMAWAGMENWGVVSYRENILLTSDKTSFYKKSRIAYIIAHELAHQWFGNLVTMEWWSQLWLNEGFATFMGHMAVDKLFPEWNIWLPFANKYRNMALDLDSLENSHPIEVIVKNSLQEIFDNITYKKGASIIQMIEGRFGENFRLGLSQYLKQYSYKNANTDNLWDSLSKQCGVNVRSFVGTFTKQQGFPVLSFKSTSEPNIFKVHQYQYKYNKNDNENDNDKLIWNLFIKVQTNYGSFEFTLDKKESTITIPCEFNLNNGDWIKPNFGQTGFYLIEYDPLILNRLFLKIKSNELPILDRIGLLNDSFLLAKNGTIPISTFLDLVISLENETECPVWCLIMDRIKYLLDLHLGQPYYKKLSETLIKLLKPISKRIGFDSGENDKSSDILLRDKIFTNLGLLGDEETVCECRKRFEQFKKDPSTLNSDIRNSVLSTVMMNGGESEQSEIISQYLNSKVTADKKAFLMVIGITDDENLVQKAMEFSLSKQVSNQDTGSVWQHIPHSRKEFAWKYFVDHYHSIYQEFKGNIFFKRLIRILESTSIEYYEVEEVAIISFKNDLEEDENSILSMEFNGILNNHLQGFYKSQYINATNGNEQFVMCTQFEPTDARRAFPCFDEPSLKASFIIKLTIDQHLTAISNMNLQSIVINPNSNSKTIKFYETPLMSTYVLGYMIGDFQYIERMTKEDVRVRVYSVKGTKEDSEFALDVATKTLSFFTNYFEIPYPLKKCDQVALPEMSHSAMENWGVITYRENILLTSDKTNFYKKSRIAYIIAHEIAHQWFGNLVTMEWWSQLWLNEGFATFMGYLAVDKLFPEWNIWLPFADKYHNRSLDLDSLENSHPIEVNVKNSFEIFEIFDNITYKKGASIIQMIEGRFGENFRLGLSQYLKQYSYKNANTENLWDSLSKQCGVNVRSFVDTFTKQQGFPVLSFKSTSEPNIFKVHQYQYKYNKNDNENDNDKLIWNLFIKVQTNYGSFEFTLDKKESTITIPCEFNLNNGDWIKPNFGQTGFYLIEYDPLIIKGLIPKIKLNELPVLDLIGLLNDSFLLAKNGTIPISTFLDLVSNFENETEYGEIFIKLLKPISKRIGFDSGENDKSSDILLRDKIFTNLGLLGDEETVCECRKRFEQFKKDPSTLNSDIRNSVLSTVMMNGGESEQSEIISQYLNSKVTADKNSFLLVLALNSNNKLIEKALKFSLSKQVSSHDVRSVWENIPDSGKEFAWKYFVDHFDLIYKKFKGNVFFKRIIGSIFKCRLEQSQYDQIKEFFDKHPIEIADRAIQQYLEYSRINMKFFEYSKNNLENWLNIK